jgi:HAD superfamily hydrolase (TIGR01509 family)
LIKAVFFDLYETLITEWENNRLKAPYTIDGIGLEPDIYKQEWLARKDKRMEGAYPDFHSVLRDILHSQGLPIDEEKIDFLYQKRVASKSIPFKKIENEIIATLQWIRNIDIKIGLISNCAPEEVLGWNSSELPKLFDCVIFSYDVKIAKPNKQIYLTACKKLDVTPEQSLFIGDGGSNELSGASAAGMSAYHATWYQPQWLSEKITGFPKINKPIQLIDIINEYLDKE